uniref:Alternative protein CHN1 n=1 Tax=Homo sapiens TaxID=9606 RepID=L0R6E9_HUMAN|nr:alternative protein CHN1 [Homo sapiens]
MNIDLLFGNLTYISYNRKPLILEELPVLARWKTDQSIMEESFMA